MVITSETKQYARIPLLASVSTSTQYQLPIAPTPTPIASTPIFITIDGPLPEGRQLTHPLVVLVEDDDGEVLVSEPHFHMHASGATLPEAIEAFKRIFSGYLDVLSEDEERLGDHLGKQLQYLRSAIRTV